MRKRSTAEEHAMAASSAQYVFERLKWADVETVMRNTGLCQLRARRAIRDLVKRGRIRKVAAAWEAVTP